MLTLPQLYKMTSTDRKDRATYVKIMKMKTGYDNQGFGYVAAQTYSRFKVDQNGKLVPNTGGNKYVSVITFVDSKLHCKVSCSCADTLYRFEVANFMKDAADIEYSNGAAPDSTNSTYRPSLCKHLASVYLKIKDKLPK